jgi:hypothetical protein
LKSSLQPRNGFSVISFESLTSVRAMPVADVWITRISSRKLNACPDTSHEPFLRRLCSR